MKIKSLIASILMVCAGFTASAQMAGGPQSAPVSGSQGPGTLRGSLGLAYGTKAGFDDNFEDTGKLGINAGIEYFFTENISIAPSYTYFFPSSAELMGYEVSANLSELNVDGRYYINAGGMSVYGMAGLALAYAKAEAEGNSESDNKAGVNLGGGLYFPISDAIGLDTQVKYSSPVEQIVVKAGISFRIR